MALPQRAEPRTCMQAYERGGCLVQWMYSPFSDLHISRVEGKLQNIEQFAGIYRDLYSKDELELGQPIPLDGGDYVAFWFRWTE